jgi:hypothetical protein
MILIVTHLCAINTYHGGISMLSSFNPQNLRSCPVIWVSSTSHPQILKPNSSKNTYNSSLRQRAILNIPRYFGQHHGEK